MPAKPSFGITPTVMYAQSVKTIEYNSIVGVIPKEGLPGLGWAFSWYDKEKNLDTCVSLTWLTLASGSLLVGK